MKERGIISICDWIWLGANLIKLTLYGGKLGGDELVMERNRQLPRVVHSTTEKLENEASFLRLGLPSTLIHHENGVFRKVLRTRRI